MVFRTDNDGSLTTAAIPKPYNISYFVYLNSMKINSIFAGLLFAMSIAPLQGHATDFNLIPRPDLSKVPEVLLLGSPQPSVHREKTHSR